MEVPLFISATGPDGAGKDTAWKNAMPHLSSDLTIVKIGKPSSVIQNGKEIYVHTATSRILDSLHSWADSKRSKKLTLLSNALIVLFQWRVQEPWLIYQAKPDLVFSLRDGYADPAAYARYYSPDTLGKQTIPKRIETLQKIHGSPIRDLTVFLDVSPEVAVWRISERMQREATQQGLLRPKWIHQHENVEDLTAIREEYLAVLGYLQKNKGTQVERIDTNNMRKPDVGSRLAFYINQGTLGRHATHHYPVSA